MRILYTSYHGLGYGGAEVSLLHLAEAMQKLGHEVFIASADTFSGVHTIQFHFALFPYEVFDRRLEKILIRVIREKKIDVIHANDRLTSVAAVQAGIKTGIKTVVHFRDYWFCCPNSTLMNKKGRVYDAKSYVKMMKNLPLSRSLINTYKYFYLKKARTVLNKADMKIAVSTVVARTLSEYGIRDHVLVLHNGRHITPVKREKKKKRLFRVGFMGSFFVSKGVLQLLQLMERISQETKKIEFVACGDGPLLHYCKKYAHEHHFPAVFTGRLRENELDAMYQTFEVVLLPSLWQEPFSGVPLEAGLHKIPIIASKMGGNTESVVDGFNGYLVDPLHLDLWEKKILELYHHPKLRKKMGEQGRKLVEERFDIKKIAIKMEELYKKLLR